MDSSRVASYVFIAVIVIGVAALGLADQLQSPTTAATQSTSICPASYPFSILSNQSSPSPPNALPPFVIDAGSSMVVCVAYTDFFNQTFSEPTYGSAYLWTSSGQFAPAPDVSISSSPAYINLTQGQSVIVAYTITASLQSKGFYAITLLQICQPLELAVGYPAPLVSYADFPGANGPRSCPAQEVRAALISAEGGYSGSFPP